MSIVCWMCRAGKRKKDFLADGGKRVLYERANEEGKGNTSIAKKKTTTKSAHIHIFASLFYLSETGSKELGPTPCPACPAFIGNIG